MKTKSKGKFGGKLHRLGFDERGNVSYGEDLLYSGSFYLGENSQEMKLIYDTGSDWLVVEGINCPKCNGNKFDPSESTNFEQVSERKEEKKYGSFVHVTGSEVKDSICLEPFTNCVDPFKFFLVED